MRFGRFIFLGALIGLSACVWLTLTQPRHHGDQTAKPPAPKPTASPSLSLAPTITPVVAGQASVRLSPYNVTLTVVDPVADLVYGEVTDSTGTWVGFTTESLLAKYPGCKAGALGVLVRTKAPTPSPTRSPTPTPSATPYPSRSPVGQPFKKTVGGYTYTYRPSYFNCTTDQTGRDTLAADRAAVVNAVLPTITQ